MRLKLAIPVMAVLATLAFASSASAAVSFDARGSMKQVYATGLPAGASTSLLDSNGNVVETRNASFLGGILFRDVTPGTGYRVRLNTTSPAEKSDPLTVLSTDPAPPDTSVYDQTIPNDGYGYMTTRDGTKLAYAVHPPSDVTGALGVDPPPAVPGPSPTLIEYSGYGYANPDYPDSGIAALANIMGFTVVDVNMRGTGCSGGAFDFFEPAQSLDGYDVIETVANQDWVANGKPGMLGISYGGISQLFTGQTQPPSLAALAPLSVIDQTQTTLYPGGVLNTGFAVDWAKERQQQAKPANPTADPNDSRYGGQGYAKTRIADGDATCESNQALHPEAADLMGKIRANDHYIPEVADPLAPTTFVDKINVPMFMACQWTDEQTGGHCPTLADKVLSGPHPEQKWFTFTNGVHTDSLDPETINKMFDFLNIYVAKQSPSPFAATNAASAPIAMQTVFGIGSGGNPSPEMLYPLDPIQALPYPLAKQQFEEQDPVRVLFDNGAGKTPITQQQHPRWPYPGFEQSFDDWPVPGQQARSWYVGPDGSLNDQKPGQLAADKFTWDAASRPLDNFDGDTGSGNNGLWTDTPSYDWKQEPGGTEVAYVTSPLTADTGVVGAGAVDVWVRSSSPNVDLQATVSEISPDGNSETFVQGGWVKAKARKLDPAKSTELEPVLSLKQEDFKDLPPDKFVKVTIPLYYEGHMYREGSRIRARISAPNGDQPIWSFAEADPEGTANVEIGYGGTMASRLLLPVIPGLNAGSSQPACNSLRGEPCRSYESFDNTASPSQPTSADVADESGGGGGSPTMSLRVRPRRPHDDRTYNFKLIVTSSDSNCLGGVTVRLGGETARTDSRGIAHISHRYGKPGTRTAKAGKAGCGKARFEITVRP